MDNNGNGLVDEGRLVLTRNDGQANATRSVLCTYVREMFEGEIGGDNDDDNGNLVFDECGFNVHRDGDVLTIRICVEEPSYQDNSVTRSMAVSIRIRN